MAAFHLLALVSDSTKISSIKFDINELLQRDVHYIQDILQGKACGFNFVDILAPLVNLSLGDSNLQVLGDMETAPLLLEIASLTSLSVNNFGTLPKARLLACEVSHKVMFYVLLVIYLFLEFLLFFWFILII